MSFARIAAAAALALATTLAASPSHAGRSVVTIINESEHTVLSVHTAPTHRSRYGDTDLLGSSTMLRPGFQVQVDFNVPDAENLCLQDVVAISTTGQRWQKRMDICATSTWRLGN